MSQCSAAAAVVSRLPMTHKTVVQSQAAVSAYFSSKQILPFASARQYKPKWDVYKT